MNAHDETPGLALLKRGKWFGSLPEPLQQHVLALSTVRDYPKRSRLIREGAMCRGLFAVLAGRVHVVRDVAGGSEALIHVGEAGFWFGEYGLLSGERAIASVVAATDVRVLLLSTSEFEHLVAETPAYYPHFTRLLADRFATMFRFASEARSVAAEDWLRLRLRDLAAEHLRDAPRDGPIDIALSQSELASMIGVSRQTLCVLLRRLQERGEVEVAYRKVRVLPATASGRRAAPTLGATL